MGIEAETLSPSGGRRRAPSVGSAERGSRSQQSRGVACVAPGSEASDAQRGRRLRRDCRFSPETGAARALQTSLIGTAP